MYIKNIYTREKIYTRKKFKMGLTLYGPIFFRRFSGHNIR